MSCYTNLGDKTDELLDTSMSGESRRCVEFSAKSISYRHYLPKQTLGKRQVQCTVSHDHVEKAKQDDKELELMP